MSWECRLDSFLIDAFSVQELQHLLKQLNGGQELLQWLPAPSSQAQFVSELMDAMQRRKLIGRELFALLSAARPERSAEIERLQNKYVEHLGASAMPSPTQLPFLSVRVLHVSHLAFPRTRKRLHEQKLHSLVAAVAEMRVRGMKPDLIIITGNTTETGHSEEFDHAYQFLSTDLCSAAEIERWNIFNCPSCYDFDPALDAELITVIRNAYLRDESQDWLRKVSEELLRARLKPPVWLSRFENARILTERLRASGGTGRPWWSDQRVVRGIRVHVSILNGCLLYTRSSGGLPGSKGHRQRKAAARFGTHMKEFRPFEPGEGRGQQLMSDFQVEQVLLRAHEADLVIGAFHLPPSYLAAWDAAVCMARIREACSILLYGDPEDHGCKVVADGGQGPLETTAGPMIANCSTGISYQLIELDPRRGEARVHPQSSQLHSAPADHRIATDGVLHYSLRRSRARQQRPAGVDNPKAITKGGRHDDYAELVRLRTDVLRQPFRRTGGPSALSEVFVELQLTDHPDEIQYDMDAVFAQGRESIRRIAGGRDVGLPGRRFHLQEIAGLKHNRWVVIGEPGSGKSTLLHNTVLALLGARDWLPVFLRIDELGANVLDSVESSYDHSARQLVEEALERGRVVFVIDGLDEAVDRQKAMNNVGSLCRAAGSSQVILSSRPIGFHSPNAEFINLVICPLGKVEQRALLMAWLNDERQVDHTMEHLSRTPRLRRLAENPLMLTLVGLVVLEGYELPERRGQLYESALRIFISGNTAINKSSRSIGDPEIALEMLSWLALHVHDSASDAYAGMTLVDLLVKHGQRLSIVNTYWNNPSNFISYLARCTGLLVTNDVNPSLATRYAFPHRTFREYLAACALERDICEHGISPLPEETLDGAAYKNRFVSASLGSTELQRVLDLAASRPETWSEVISLTCGRLPSPAPGEIVGMADHLVRWVAATGNHDLVQRVVADAEGVSAETVLRVLGLEKGWYAWERRRNVIEQLPAMVGDLVVAVKLVRRFLQHTTDGNDLYVMDQLLRRIAAGQAEGGSRDTLENAQNEAENLLRTLFDYLPAESRAVALSSLSKTWLEVRAGEFRATRNSTRRKKGFRKSYIVAQDYVMMDRPVTWEMYLLFDPGHGEAIGKRPDGSLPQGWETMPVYNVTWQAAAMFARWVGCRLPLEAEWEWACRAGTVTDYWCGSERPRLDAICWHSGTSSGTVHPVGSKGMNPWGFIDMHGNVWEWCLDPYDETIASANSYVANSILGNVELDGSVRPSVAESEGIIDVQVVVRGGAWSSLPTEVRSDYREGRSIADYDNDLGFRLVKLSAAKKGEGE